MNMRSNSSVSKQVFGMPVNLVWGFIAIAIFMAGDGVEQAFLSEYILNLGFSTSQSALVFTIYGITVALASWLSGVLAEIWGPRRTMLYGLVLWIVFHIGFLVFGLQEKNFAMMVLMYGIRGLGYPLFAYAFIVWIAKVTPSHKLSSAMGWFWFMYSVGIGFLGAYYPSFAIPHLGYMGTLWSSIVLIVIGGIFALFLIRDKSDHHSQQKEISPKEKFQQVLKSITILYEKPKIAIAGVVRIINQIGLYAFIVILPIFFTKTIGFTTSEWLLIWGNMFIANMIFALVWGFLGDKIGWVKQVRWFGCIGSAFTTLSFYYVPLAIGKDFWMTVLVAALYGITLAAFVPMSAIIPSLAPENKGAAISVHNLAAGLSQFVGPAIVALLMPLIDIQGVIWTISILYVAGAILTYFFEIDQSTLLDKEDAA